MGLFGLKITPGEIVPIAALRDVRITNIAYGEEVSGQARSVVKVHHARIPGLMDELFDDEEDSEDDDEEDQEDEDDEEEIDDIVDGAEPSAEEEDEDEDEDEEIDSDDEEDEYVEEEYVVCSLYPSKIEQVTVDLHFSADEEVAFSVSGENDVELLGYYLSPDMFDEDPDSDEFDEDDDEYDSDEMALYGEEDESEDDDEDMDDVRIEEIADDVPKTKKSIAASNPKKRSAKDADVDGDISAPVGDAELAAVAKAAGVDVSQLSKNQKKKLNKKLKTEAGNDSEDVKEKVEVVQKDAKDGNVKVQAAKKEVAKKDGKEVSELWKKCLNNS